MVASFAMFEPDAVEHEEPFVDFILAASQFIPFELDPNIFGLSGEESTDD